MALSDPLEHSLVLKALSLRLGGCCNWHRSAREKFVNDPEVAALGLTPEGIPDLLADHVHRGKKIYQRPQDKEWEGDCEYWYAAKLQIDTYRKRLFTKLILRDDDPDYPVVEIVSCHF